MKMSVLILATLCFASPISRLGSLPLAKQSIKAKKEKLEGIPPFQSPNKYLDESEAVAHIFKGLSSRFKPIKKEQLSAAFSARSFLPEEHLNRIDAINTVGIKLLDDDQSYGVGIFSKGDLFSSEQLKVLNNMPYSTNFVVDIHADRHDPTKGNFKGEDHYTPHFSLVPEVQAEYKLGLGALYAFLRANCEKEIDLIDEDKLGPGRIYIKVGIDGKLTDVELKSSSRQAALDQRVLELMRSLPGEWKVAEAADGSKVEQELVLFFGILGC